MQLGSETAVEQEKLLEAALHVVKTESFQMKRYLDKGKLMDALKSCSQMLSELRTCLLTPKYYYRLFIDVTNELQHLELFLVDEFQKDRRIPDLYELVQYAGSIIPRLYLLITVAVVYIKTAEASRKDLLKDLVEMCRGVQHPMRGLFLRSFLLQSTRTLLPDQETEGELDKDGTVKDAVEFIIMNFCEMNKLWVRMQHQGSSKDKEKREKERLELRTLVGTNLVRLSELEFLDADAYIKVVLPTMLEQVVSCRDPIAQEYLMECIIQVFSDEFHIATLNTFLKACAELHQHVNIRVVLTALIDRLASYVSLNPNSVSELLAQVNLEATTTVSSACSDPSLTTITSLFDIFYLRICQVVESFKERETAREDAIALHASLLNMALKCYPHRIDYIDKIFMSIGQALGALKVQRIDPLTSVGRDLISLLNTPLLYYNNMLRLLEIPNYLSVVNLLDYAGRCQVCSMILTNALENCYEKPGNALSANYITSVGHCEGILNLIQALVVKDVSETDDTKKSSVQNVTNGFKKSQVDESSKSSIGDRPLDDFYEEQTLVARMITLMYNDNPDQYYLILNCARKHLSAGGKERFKYTFPPLVFSAYKVASMYMTVEDQDAKWEKKIQKVFHFCHQTISVFIKEVELPETSLRLFLQGALTIDKMPMFQNKETTTYEFVSQALSLYEDEIGDSKAQLWAITLIIGALQKITGFTSDNLEPLRSQCVMASSKLFKKPDQCRGVALSAHLFWPPKLTIDLKSEQALTDAKKTVDCLQKSMKIAGQCMDQVVQLQLFVELLNSYVYFYEKQCPIITTQMISELISKIRDILPGVESMASETGVEELNQVKKYFENTIIFLNKAKQDRPQMYIDLNVI